MRRRPDHAAPSTIGGGSMNPLRLAVVVVPLAVLSVVPRAHAQLLLSTNDNKVTLVNGVGTLALVANRAEGTVSVYTVQGKTVTPAGKVTVADDKSGTSHAAISPDGKLALVTCSRSTAPRSNTPSATSRRACGLTA